MILPVRFTITAIVVSFALCVLLGCAPTKHEIEGCTAGAAIAHVIDAYKAELQKREHKP